MRRDQQIQAIVDVGRRTRTGSPRWVWIAATLVGAACATGFAVAMLGAREPAPQVPPEPPGRAVAARPAGAGSGVGLAVGAGAALVIGAAIARQRRSHSSRNSP